MTRSPKITKAALPATVADPNTGASAVSEAFNTVLRTRVQNLQKQKRPRTSKPKVVN